MWHSLRMPIPVLMAVGDCELHRSAINDLRAFMQTLQQLGDHGLLTRRLLPQSSVASVQTANLLPHFLDANMWHSLRMPIPVQMASKPEGIGAG